ncbi:MAG: hypothetical protein JRF53_00505 [Deltaproteobacteria bacterium]|nr:hypothetical protein [Deltaproteobacteria bacterium]
MKKLLIITAFICLLCPASTFAETAESKSSPPTIQKIAPESYYYNYNIQEIQKDPDGDGPMEAETFYRYNYVTIQGKPSKLKVLNAIAEAESSTATVAIEGVATDRTTAQDKLAQISAMTYAQIDTHVDSTFSALSTAQKSSLKKLYKAVLALIKNMDFE